MSYADIALIALVALFAVFGVLRGVKKSSVAFGAFLVAFIIAFFLAKPIAEAMLGIDGIRSFVMGGDGWSLYTFINGRIGLTPLEELDPQNFFFPIKAIVETYTSYNSSFTQGNGMALYSAYLIWTVIVGVALYIVARLLLCIATMIIKSFIGKKKTGLQRFGGFVLGAVRGFSWGFVITFICTCIMSLNFVGFIGKVDAEFGDKSVVAKTVYNWAYLVRDKMYLPNSDMYARIITKSGLIKIEDDDQKEPENELIGVKLDIYSYFINFNYKETACTINDGKLTYKDGYEEKAFDPEDYKSTGFDSVVKAILDYNAASANAIKTGVLDSLDETMLTSYDTILQSGAESQTIYDNLNAVWGDLVNYERLIQDSKEYTDGNAISQANSELETIYDSLVTKLDSLKSKYGVIAATFGELSLGEYPEVVKAGH